MVTADLDFLAVGGSMLAIQPTATTVAIVLGANRLEQYWAEQIQRGFATLADRVRLVLLTDLSLGGVRRRVAELAPHSAVFYYMFAVGADGLQYENEQALAAIRGSTNAPIFGSFASQPVNGIVRGRLIDMAQFGRESAPMAVRMLAGERGGHTHVATQPPTFDWRELQRWQIPESRLPSGASVRFRSPSLWEERKGFILAGAAVVMFQATSITALLFQSGKASLYLHFHVEQDVQ